jgi:hypothetical protein
VTIHDNPYVVNTPLHLTSFLLQLPKQVSSILEFTCGLIFQNEGFMEDYVADIAAPPKEAAAYSSNSGLPAILMILPNVHRLLQKLQHILLLQRTFETFVNCKQKAQECKEEQNNNCYFG